MKVFTDDKIDVTEKLKFALGRVKTLLEEEKMLSNNIFKRFPFQGHKKSGLSCKVLNEIDTLSIFRLKDLDSYILKEVHIV